MPDKKLYWTRFTDGLYLSAEPAGLPLGTTLRNRGIHPVLRGPFRSRDGSTQLHALLAAHSLVYFNDTWYSGLSTAFYEGTTSRKTGLSSSRLAFAAMPPVAGGTDYLFVAGGADLFKISDYDYDSDDYAVPWGIVPPDNTFTVADGGGGGSLDDGAVYKYALTYYNDQTGTRSNPTTLSFSNVRLLRHCDGSDEHTTFTDSSLSAHTVTANGDAQGDTAQKKFGTASLLCDGDGDYLSVPDHPDWNFGSERFMIDFWVRFSSVASQQDFYLQYEDANNYIQFIWSQSAGELQFNAQSAGAQKLQVSGSWSPSINTWYHVAIIRGWNDDDNTFALTVNGSAVGTLTQAVALPDVAGQVQIGEGTASFAGWMDEFRILAGTADRTATFTAPTTAYGTPNVDLGGGSTSVDLSNLPSSSDVQVSHLEIWRTAGGGSSYYLLTRLINGATSYTDNISDDYLGADELPTDNLKPYSWFDDCFGPYNASMFWLTRSQSGERGRVYYSPIGRAEAVQGFINVTSDDLGLQKGVVYNNTPFVLGEAGIYQISGTNPYFTLRIEGVPVTVKPHTVAVTPRGIIYEAADGIRIFNGSTSALCAPDQLQVLFRGLSSDNLDAFSGTVAAYGRGEYFISDLTQLIAYNPETNRWRDVGDLRVTALFYAKDADIIGAACQILTILNLEKEGDTDDNSNDIQIDLETSHVRLGGDIGGTVKHVHIEHLSGDSGEGQTLTVYLEADGEETELGDITAYTKGIDTLHVNRQAREFGFRITGSLDDWVQINQISATVNIGEEELQ